MLEANKGRALIELARTTSSDATLYLGDDVTDELAFAALDRAAGDLTVKVGNGETVAAHRIHDPGSVVALLELFVALRQSPDLTGSFGSRHWPDPPCPAGLALPLGAGIRQDSPQASPTTPSRHPTFTTDRPARSCR